MKPRALLTLAFLFAVSTAGAYAAQFKALLITNTNGWHHDSIEAAVPALQGLAKLHDVDLVWPNLLSAVLTDKGLADYQVIIFALTTGDILNDEQQAAVERFVKSGKGFVSLHTGTDTEYDWPWYTKMEGTTFHIHPAVQTATVVVQDPIVARPINASISYVTSRRARACKADCSNAASASACCPSASCTSPR
jgi:type 1 glutamine amidotransferase